MMKFIVSSSYLLKQLQVLGSVINSSNTLPILDNFLFEIKDQNFPVGTLVIPRGVNQSIAEFDDIIKSSANQTRVDIYPVASGYVSKGKDFGSSSYQEIYLPKVGVLSGGDLSPLNTGEIWHFFEKELDLPFRMFRISELNIRDNISDLDVIVLPEGQVSEMQLEKLRDWIYRS